MTRKKLDFKDKINIKNRKASFEYQFIDKYVAGLVLKGTEIKSIRLGKVNLQDSYCTFFKDELFVKEMHIAPYEQARSYNHEAKRDRKLLLNKRELNKLNTKHKEKGLTIIPTRIFINDKGLAKLEIALAKGKKVYDKRENIKQRDLKRDMARMNIK